MAKNSDMRGPSEPCHMCQVKPGEMTSTYDYRYHICVQDGRCWYRYDNAMLDIAAREAVMAGNLLAGVSPIAPASVPRKPKWRVLLGRFKHWLSGLFMRNDSWR